MLICAKQILGHSLEGADGRLGRVADLDFDDQSWTVRYVVVDTGGWLTGQQVLISPAVFGHPDWNQKSIPVGLTKQQVEQSPPINAHQTVSRRMEAALQEHYGWPAYWAEPPAEFAGPAPSQPGVPSTRRGAEAKQAESEMHLRSMREMTGYHVHAEGGEAGRLEDFLVEADTWKVRYIEVKTGKWFAGRSFLVSPAWIESVSWSERSVQVDLPVSAIRSAPEYDPSQPVTREYEKRLHAHYTKPGYWGGTHAAPRVPR
jgi:hypothetical protein